MSHLEEGLFHALLDGEVPSDQLGPIQAHLASCAECRERLEQERQLLAEAAGLVEVLEVPVEARAHPPTV
ncbi:MAG TPA: zf-HC2 domain-containing protein, partial [Gemmatimonadales bacterium]